MNCSYEALKIKIARYVLVLHSFSYYKIALLIMSELSSHMLMKNNDCFKFFFGELLKGQHPDSGSSGKIFAKFGLFATSLHRYFATTQKMLSEKNTPLLHRYFATTFQKLDSEPSEKCPPKKITPSLHCYFATTSGKWPLRKNTENQYTIDALA